MNPDSIILKSTDHCPRKLNRICSLSENGTGQKPKTKSSSVDIESTWSAIKKTIRFKILLLLRSICLCFCLFLLSYLQHWSVIFHFENPQKEENFVKLVQDEDKSMHETLTRYCFIFILLIYHMLNGNLLWTNERNKRETTTKAFMHKFIIEKRNTIFNLNANCEQIY